MTQAASALGGRERHSVAVLALALFVFTIPWENSLRLNQIGTAARLSGVIAILISALRVLSTGRIRRPNRALVAMGALVAWSGTSLVWTSDFAATVQRTFTLAQLFLLAWLIWEHCRTSSVLNLLLGSYLAGAAVSLAGLLVRFARGQTVAAEAYGYLPSSVLARQTERFSASGFDPNVVALLLALGIPAAWWLARTARTRRRRLTAALYPLPAAVGIVLTGSRGAVVSVGLGIIVTMAVSGSHRWAYVLASVVLVAASIPLIVRVAPERTIGRVTSVNRVFATGEVEDRLDIWRHGYDIYARRPLTGVGAGAFPAVSEPVFGKPRVAHNVYLSVLYELGAVGLGILLWLGVLLVRRLRKAPGGVRGVLVAWVAMWAGSGVSLTMEPRKVTFLVWGLANAVGSIDNVIVRSPDRSVVPAARPRSAA